MGASFRSESQTLNGFLRVGCLLMGAVVSSDLHANMKTARLVEGTKQRAYMG